MRRCLSYNIQKIASLISVQRFGNPVERAGGCASAFLARGPGWGEHPTRYLANDDIKDETLRVVMEDGTHEVMTRVDALKYAVNKKMDLVLISPNSVPPVAKVMDFAHFKHHVQQAEKTLAKKNREKEKQRTAKEVRLRPRITDHDLQQKLRKVDEFLMKGIKVNLVVLYKGESEQRMANEALQYILSVIQESHDIGTEIPKSNRKNALTIQVIPSGKPLQNTGKAQVAEEMKAA